jgi:hypothetical protein
MQIQYKRKPGYSFERFGSRSNMQNYFQATRERAEQREKEIEEDYDFGENMDIQIDLEDVPSQSDFFPQDGQPEQRDD